MAVPIIGDYLYGIWDAVVADADTDGFPDVVVACTCQGISALFFWD
jgi:hypothetical protein